MENKTLKTKLSAKLSLGRKIGMFLDHLQDGGEIKIDGHTWVWCDNYITHQETDDDGNTQCWGIDGLAIKGVQINSQTGEEKPHYIGQNQMSVHHLIQLVEQLTDDDIVGMGASIALKSMNKKREA